MFLRMELKVAIYVITTYKLVPKLLFSKVVLIVLFTTVQELLLNPV